jgi:hypothetical protein
MLSRGRGEGGGGGGGDIISLMPRWSAEGVKPFFLCRRVFSWPAVGGGGRKQVKGEGGGQVGRVAQVQTRGSNY